MKTLTTRKGKPRGYGACPSWLCARFREASRPGGGGYEITGRELLRATMGLCPIDIEEDAWADEIGRLCAMFEDSDGRGILAWFDRLAPRVMVMVPRRRRPQLLSGMLRAYRDTEGDWLDIAVL